MRIKYSLSSDNDEKDRLLPRNKFKLRICWEAVIPQEINISILKSHRNSKFNMFSAKLILLSLRIYSYLHSECLREWKHLSPSLPNQEYGTDILLFLSLHWHTNLLKPSIYPPSLLFLKCTSFSPVLQTIPMFQYSSFFPQFWNSLITCNPNFGHSPFWLILP